MMKLIRIGVVISAACFVLSISAAAPGGTQYTLTSGRDYTHDAGNSPTGCPQCKDLFYSTKPITSPSGTVITSITVVDRTPKKNNHWYRCQVEVNCGVEEFADVNQRNKTCIGTNACVVYRATDGSEKTEQDVIDVRWK
jgi:hypothetical protein